MDDVCNTVLSALNSTEGLPIFPSTNLLEYIIRNNIAKLPVYMSGFTYTEAIPFCIEQDIQPVLVNIVSSLSIEAINKAAQLQWKNLTNNSSNQVTRYSGSGFRYNSYSDYDSFFTAYINQYRIQVLDYATDSAKLFKMDNILTYRSKIHIFTLEKDAENYYLQQLENFRTMYDNKLRIVQLYKEELDTNYNIYKSMYQNK